MIFPGKVQYVWDTVKKTIMGTWAKSDKTMTQTCSTTSHLLQTQTSTCQKSPIVMECKILSFSIYWGLVTHICVSELGLVQVMARHLSGLRHYLNQWWPCELVLMNKLQWSVNQNTFFFIKRNMHLKMLCEMKAILCRLECVNGINQIISF